MALGPVVPYNKLMGILASSANRQWDDATAGNVMFCLAKATYTPSKAHTTVANLGVADTDYIATGAGAPIAATGLAVDDTSAAGKAFLDSDAANFGSSVTLTAKYLIAVMPVTAGVFASTAKLLWYVDLNTAGGSVAASAAPFSIPPPAYGWLGLENPV